MRIVSVFLFLLLTPMVFANGVLIQSPANGTTIESGKDPLTFSIEQDYRTIEIYTCSVVVDNETYKTIPINTVLGGQSRQTTQQLAEGAYTWMITCDTETGNISSLSRTIKVFEPVKSDAEVSPSGDKGSLIHKITMTNTIEQESLFVSEIVPGDYLGITVSQGPSKFYQEFYLMNKRTSGNKNYLVFENKQDQFDIYEGENKTVSVGSANVILYFHSLVGFRANIVVYPSVIVEPEVEEIIEEEPVIKEVVAEEPIIEEIIEEEPVIKEIIEELPEKEVEIPEKEPPKKKRQGFFSWIGSLLSNLFGL